MKLMIDIPTTLEATLREQFGEGISEAAREILAIARYESEKLSIGQFAEFLGLSIYDAEGLLKQRRVTAPYSLEDFEHGRETIRNILKP